jgi:hypothetical protein
MSTLGAGNDAAGKQAKAAESAGGASRQYHASTGAGRAVTRPTELDSAPARAEPQWKRRVTCFLGRHDWQLVACRTHHRECLTCGRKETLRGGYWRHVRDPQQARTR